MYCKHCDKPATFHITDLVGGTPTELHLCADHVKAYLVPQAEAEEVKADVAGVLAQQLQVGQTAEELARLDQKSCPVCGISFYEFRHAGRLGCPHDYVCFEHELEPLIMNIHGAAEHSGKEPKHGSPAADDQTRLIQLRREMKEAVEQEDYERASVLRDEIRELEAKHRH